MDKYQRAGPTLQNSLDPLRIIPKKNLIRHQRTKSNKFPHMVRIRSGPWQFNHQYQLQPRVQLPADRLDSTEWNFADNNYRLGVYYCADC